MEEYILYIHPNITSTQYKSVEKYWYFSNKALYWKNIEVNTAMHYPFHISLTSFFESDDINFLISVIERELKSIKDTKIVDKMVYYKTEKFIGIYTPVESLKNFLTNMNLLIPTKSYDNLHMTLAHNYKEKDLNIIKKLLTLILPLEQWTDDWLIVLWKVTNNRKNWKLCKKFKL